VLRALGKHWDRFDILVHRVAYAPREAIEGEFLDGLTRENFDIAHDISAYSLARDGQGRAPMMAGRNGAS
jgi:enoyl-[acyl-carrier protein] reductase I